MEASAELRRPAFVLAASVLELEFEALLVPPPCTLSPSENSSSAWDLSAAFLVVGFFRLCGTQEGSTGLSVGASCLWLSLQLSNGHLVGRSWDGVSGVGLLALPLCVNSGEAPQRT